MIQIRNTYNNHKPIGAGNDNPELYQYYYHSDHLGSASYITNLEGEIVQHIEYIPFGEVFIEERNNVWNTPFLFNGKELDEETGLYYYGARYYNPRESVWLSVDPLAEKYPGWSPYNYTLQNPVKFIDPDGRDVILLIWASYNGKIGHAGIAISNYKEVSTRVKENGKWVTKKEMVPDGTYTYRDLWPGGNGVGKSNFDKDIPSSYNKRVFTLDKLKNMDVTGSEGYAADGVIQLSTDYITDWIVNKALDAHEKYNPSYNGLTNNCTDYVEAGVSYASEGNKVNADEKLTDKTSATTPNQMYKSASKLPNAKILKNPGKKVEQGFLEAVSKGRESKAEKKVD